MITLNEAPIVKTGMLIRRPVSEVFEALVNPEITTAFWFTKSSGRLEAGKRVRWEWGMYGVSAEVDVIAVEVNQRLLFNWAPDDTATVEWTFTPHGEDKTYVTVVNAGFQGSGDEIVHQATDAMEGFTMVLCALKALLEHNVRLTVVADKAPPQG